LFLAAVKLILYNILNERGGRSCGRLAIDRVSELLFSTKSANI